MHALSTEQAIILQCKKHHSINELWSQYDAMCKKKPSKTYARSCVADDAYNVVCTGYETINKGRTFQVFDNLVLLEERMKSDPYYHEFWFSTQETKFFFDYDRKLESSSDKNDSDDSMDYEEILKDSVREVRHYIELVSYVFAWVSVNEARDRTHGKNITTLNQDQIDLLIEDVLDYNPDVAPDVKQRSIAAMQELIIRTAIVKGANDPSRNKISFHVIFPAIILANIKESKSYDHLIRDIIKACRQKAAEDEDEQPYFDMDETIDLRIDSLVYRQGSMRMLWQMKRGCGVPLEAQSLSIKVQGRKLQTLTFTDDERDVNGVSMQLKYSLITVCQSKQDHFLFTALDDVFANDKTCKIDMVVPFFLKKKIFTKEHATLKENAQLLLSKFKKSLRDSGEEICVSEPNLFDQKTKPRSEQWAQILKHLLRLLGDKDPKYYSEYKYWIYIGFACFSTFAECAKTLQTQISIEYIESLFINAWDEFSQRCKAKYEEGGCRKYWNQMTLVSSPVTMGSIFYMCKQEGIDYKDEISRYRMVLQTNLVNAQIEEQKKFGVINQEYAEPEIDETDSKIVNIKVSDLIKNKSKVQKAIKNKNIVQIVSQKLDPNMFSNLGFMESRSVYCCKSEKSTGKTSNFFKYLQETVLKTAGCKNCEDVQKEHEKDKEEYKKLTRKMRAQQDTKDANLQAKTSYVSMRDQRINLHSIIANRERIGVYCEDCQQKQNQKILFVTSRVTLSYKLSEELLSLGFQHYQNLQGEVARRKSKGDDSLSSLSSNASSLDQQSSSGSSDEEHDSGRPRKCKDIIYGNVKCTSSDYLTEPFADSKSTRHRYDRYITQINSLHKVPDNIQYDHIVIDEIQSFANYITGNHFCTTQNYPSYQRLESLIKTSKSIVLLDADLAQSSIDYFLQVKHGLDAFNNDERLRKDYLILKNDYETYKNEKYKVDIYNCDQWIAHVVMDLEAGRRVVIPTMSKKKGIYIVDRIKERCPQKKILLMTSDCDQKLKQIITKNVNVYWAKFDVVVYSPTITMGISFDIVNFFDKIYGYVCSGSVPAREFVQMLHRVRSPAKNHIILCFDCDDKDKKLAEDSIEQLFQIHNETSEDFAIDKRITNGKAELEELEKAIKDKYEKDDKVFPGFDKLEGKHKTKHQKLCDKIGVAMKEKQDIVHEKIRERIIEFISDKRFLSTITHEQRSLSFLFAVKESDGTMVLRQDAFMHLSVETMIQNLKSHCNIYREVFYYMKAKGYEVDVKNGNNYYSVMLQDAKEHREFLLQQQAERLQKALFLEQDHQVIVQELLSEYDKLGLTNTDKLVALLGKDVLEDVDMIDYKEAEDFFIRKKDDLWQGIELDLWNDKSLAESHQRVKDSQEKTMYCIKYGITREQCEGLTVDAYARYFNGVAAKKYSNLQIIAEPRQREDETHVYLTVEEKIQELFAKDRDMTVHDNFQLKSLSDSNQKLQLTYHILKYFGFAIGTNHAVKKRVFLKKLRQYGLANLKKQYQRFLVNQTIPFMKSSCNEDVYMMKLINMMLSQMYGYTIQFGTLDIDGQVDIMHPQDTRNGYDKYEDCDDKKYYFALHDAEFWADLPNGIMHRKRQKNPEENIEDYMKLIGASHIEL